MFKFLSGDFISEYNKLLDAFMERQNNLDDEFAGKIKILVARETLRLEDTISLPFQKGDKVVDTLGNHGIVQECPVKLWVFDDEDFHGTKSGPNRYFRIEDEEDETVVTCEGLIRKVMVLVESNDIEKDWGIDNIIEYWSDELKKI